MKLICARIWMPLVVAGAALVLAPQSRAQAEVAPDHFDGTDSWEIALNAKTQALKQKQAGSAVEAQNKKSVSSPQANDSAKNAAPAPTAKVVAVEEKRTIPARKENKR